MQATRREAVVAFIDNCRDAEEACAELYEWRPSDLNRNAELRVGCRTKCTIKLHAVRSEHSPLSRRLQKL